MNLSRCRLHDILVERPGRVGFLHFCTARDHSIVLFGTTILFEMTNELRRLEPETRGGNIPIPVEAGPAPFEIVLSRPSTRDETVDACQRLNHRQRRSIRRRR
jgi:hypothetical protein